MIGIYCRITKHKEKGKDVSIETQLQADIAFAKTEGIEFKTFTGEGISGVGPDECRIVVPGRLFIKKILQFFQVLYHPLFFTRQKY